MNKNSHFFLGLFVLAVSVSTILIHLGINTYASAAPAIPSKITTVATSEPASKSSPCQTTTTTNTTSASNPVVCGNVKIFGVTVTTSGANSGAASIDVGLINLMSWLRYSPASRLYLTSKQMPNITYPALKSFVSSLLQTVPSSKGVEVWAVFECDQCYQKGVQGWTTNS